MGFNLNRTSQADYQLKERNINEMIGIYGIEAQFLNSKKMNVDKILKDFSHLKFSTEEAYPFYILPEDAENWGGEQTWDMFGLHNKRQMSFFVSRSSIDGILENFKDLTFNNILNSLFVLPSGQIMEITEFIDTVEGINNLFAFKDELSVYRIYAIPYYNNENNNTKDVNVKNEEIQTTEKEAPKEDYIQPNNDMSFDNLDDYFKSLENDETIKSNNYKSKVDDVFGDLS